eukprot:scaffold4398_cov77-Skeletonema_dohrnii-CCMP3373.AAC.2
MAVSMNMMVLQYSRSKTFIIFGTAEEAMSRNPPSFLFLLPLVSGVLSDDTDDVEAVSSLDNEDLLLVIAVRTWPADAKSNMPVAIRFPIPSTVAGDDEERTCVYCWVLTNSHRRRMTWKAGMETLSVLLLRMTESVCVSCVASDFLSTI